MYIECACKHKKVIPQFTAINKIHAKLFACYLQGMLIKSLDRRKVVIINPILTKLLESKGFLKFLFKFMLAW